MAIQKIPKADVLGVITKLGPCQPIDIRKELKQGDSFLIGALLSELVGDGTLAISKTRRGGSPFYYDPNDPTRLDLISQYLNEKDRRTYALLKMQRVMREDAQEPLVRVGLQSMPDFSKRMELDGVAYWRYYMISEDEARALLSPPVEVRAEIKAEIKTGVEEEIEETKPADPTIEEIAKPVVKIVPEPKRPKKRAVRAEPSPETPVAGAKKAKRPKKGSPEPVMMPDGAVMISPQEWLAHDTLYERVERFAAGMRIRDARVHKPHSELTCIITIDTTLGAIDTFVHAFSKKFTPEDVKATLPRARELGLPVIILSVDPIPTKITTVFKGMPNTIFKRFEEG